MDKPTLDRRELIGLSERNLSRAIAWVSVADAKARFISSVALVAIAYLLPQLRWIVGTIVALYQAGSILMVVILVALAIGTALSLAICAVLVVLSTYPSRRTSTDNVSYFYYESIATMPLGAFQERMRQMDDSQAIEGLSEQTYHVAKVVKTKFDRLATSARWLLAAVVLEIALLVASQLAVIPGTTN